MISVKCDVGAQAKVILINRQLTESKFGAPKP